MAITWEISKEEAAKRTDTRTVEFGGQAVTLASDYVGCVLRVGEHNLHSDSDFYAIVWDEAQGKVIEVEYATTRFWSYCNHAEVDITPENLEKALAYLKVKWEADIRQKSERMAHAVDKGKQVRVVKGRKVAIGTMGTVKWMGEVSYSYHTSDIRVGILVEGKDSLTYTSIKNLEVVNPEQYLMSEEDIARHIAYNAENYYVFCA